MNPQDNSDKYSNWKLILSLQCQTQKTINISSYGDWNLRVYQRDANKVDRPMYEIMKEEKIEQRYYEEGQQVVLQVADLSHLTNAKQAFKYITVNVDISEEEFRDLYGFWEINEFRVYDMDGNSCGFSFRTGDKFYYGGYGTS